MPGKSRSFTPSSILFRPRRSPLSDAIDAWETGWGGGAGYRPRVRKAYSDNHLSPYPSEDGTLNIEKARPRGKGIYQNVAPALLAAIDLDQSGASKFAKKAGKKTMREEAPYGATPIRQRRWPRA